jgi:ribosome-binding ATPase YchF (GTP1/OBG family)
MMVYTEIAGVRTQSQIEKSKKLKNRNINAAKCSMTGVKGAGKYRVEGKTYVVQDGDILHIMHNAKK